MNVRHNLHDIGLNPFAVELLAESMLKSAYVKHKGAEPLKFEFPVRRSDCAGWAGVRITLEAVSDAALPAPEAVPIDMVLFCPACGKQHIDAAEQHDADENEPRRPGGLWNNPPHRSHLCRKEDGGCGYIWRPADVPTNGVEAVKTKGKADSPLIAKAEPVAAAGVDEVDDWLLKTHAHLGDALRLPKIPFPEPYVDGHEAMARAVHTAFCAIRFKVMDAMAALTTARTVLVASAASPAHPQQAGQSDGGAKV